MAQAEARKGTLQAIELSIDKWVILRFPRLGQGDSPA
jgi:hypothetical protein